MRLLLFSFLFTTTTLHAQQTYVPDNIFEAFLESNGMGNGVPNDDYVTTANISGVTSLICWGYGISDLTGIEDFTALSMLFCFDNNLTTLDVSQNLNLSDFRCNNNQLTSLNISTNVNLSQLFCYNNMLTSLNLSGCPNLTDIRCQNNLITSINPAPCPDLIRLLCNNNQLTTLSVASNPVLFDLRCNNNQLTSLNVSQNPALASLFCYYNQLTTLDVSQNTSLTFLHCYDNLLTNLTINPITSLVNFMCYNNELTSLDVSQQPNLTTLNCSNNQLACLTANNGQDITLDCSNNPISCASVTYPTWTYANATYDPGTNFVIDCQLPIDNDLNQNGVVLSAVQNGANYQWLDCDNNYAPINNQIFQNFTPNSTGNYACEITYTNCFGTLVDTSMCIYIDCQSYINNDVLQTGATLIAEFGGISYQWLDCNNNFSPIPGATNQAFTATSEGNYAVKITFSDLCEGFLADTSSCHQVAFVDLFELTNEPAKLVKIVDLLGRETSFKPNTPLIYIYSDGKMERVFKLEE